VKCTPERAGFKAPARRHGLDLTLVSVEPLTFALALDQLFHLALVRSPRDTRCALGFRSSFLTGYAFEAFAFGFIFNVLCVHSSILIPAYFSIIFLSPYPGKLIVSFASSPSPSRRSTVPRPYLG